MVLGIPVWENRISPVFDVARHLVAIELENGAETRRREVVVEDHSPQAWRTQLRDLGVEVLICGAISDEVAASLSLGGVGILPWIRGDVDHVLAAYLAGELSDPAFLLPGTPRQA